MRIIAGKARGTNLETLDIPRLRPMLDRVKESLFNILRDEVPGASVLDLYSGSGGLGLEALSRDAHACVFVEQDGRLAALIERNAARCGLAERCTVVRADALLLHERTPVPGSMPADLVLVDPPYAVIDDPNARARLFRALEALSADWLRPGCTVVMHHRPMPFMVWPCRFLCEDDQRIYGQSQLTFFTFCGDDDGPAR